MNALSLDITALLPLPWLYAAALAALILFGVSAVYFRRGLLPRAVAGLAFLALVLSPTLIEEKREPVDDVALVVVDRSPSQDFGSRKNKTEEALAHLREELSTRPGLDLRIIEAPAGETGQARKTLLFDEITRALSDVPATRRAGIIMLTDGQVHDVPSADTAGEFGPVQGLLTGEKDEQDRQLILLEAPSYGIVGQRVTVRYRIEDTADDTTDVRVTIRQGNKPPRISYAPVNTDLSATFEMNHAGQNIIDINVEGHDNELTLANNRIPVIINGVRDRLKVLLVSGQPHAGGRTWRNFLTADPGVDLVHFTILREPHKLDATPQRELSLIAFPFQELFETKLYDFDLIIFDRYHLTRILPSYYFGNIARYVQRGGALLEASGPSYVTDESIFNTDLNKVLPAHPTGQAYEATYHPAVTEKGRRHPVTQNLAVTGEGPPGWGPWLRQIGVTPASGDVLMNGLDDRPLLILDRVGDGRVAQLASDQIWLWARGYEGGGPQGELLRRLAHWLMKEPDLEENALLAKERNGTLIIQRRSLSDKSMTVMVTTPDGAQKTIELLPAESGLLEAHITAGQLGVYSINDGEKERFVLVGALNPPELTEVVTIAEKLRPLADASNGGIHWLSDYPTPRVRLLPPGRDYNGRGWIGLRHNDSYEVTGVTGRPLLPPWIYALLMAVILGGAWWYEGRTQNR